MAPQTETPLSKAISTEFSGQDCLSCRAMGAAAFIGLGGYTYISGQRQLLQQKEVIRKSGSMFGFASRKFGITGLAAGLAGIGLWRLVN